MNRKFYNRTELAVSFVVLRPTEDGQPEENAVKVKFDPSDTIFEVSTRVKQTIEEGRRTDDDSAAIKLASALLKVPLLPNLVVHVANFLDHHDLFPKALMDALPFHTSLYVNRGQEGYTRVTLDTENYRAKREEALTRLANRMANRAVKTGRKVVLEPMNPYERRILHSALQKNENVSTHSEGEEPNRHVVITLNSRG